ncbi:MAG: hypothetical protein JWN31_529 [Frankiales bacterium]|nr:hypothetical protein [Frankiales bacterium]
MALSATLLLTAGTVASAGLTSAPLTALEGYALTHPGLGQQTVYPQALSDKGGMGVTPGTKCDRTSRPETDRQGRAPARDFKSGRAAKGYTCNLVDIGHEGDSGGFQVHRYVDKAHHECAFYDSTLLFPTNEPNSPGGVVVLDMTDPRKPVRTAVLRTLAMKTPHESFRLNVKRGLLAAVAGSPATQVGMVDVYDASADCRHPVWKSSLPLGILGHEGAFSPDGRTYWASTTADRGLSAIDLTDPASPQLLMHSLTIATHGLSVSDDGNRLYLADVQNGPTQNYVREITHGGGGMRILDASPIQNRVPGTLDLKEIGYVTWPEVTIPQSTIPVTIKGKRYLIEFDEYDSNTTAYSPDENVGGVRIIDISNERKPKVISRIRLAVWERSARASDQRNDPGASSGTAGYAAHYCSVPRRIEPGIVACSMIVSGLRVFDVRDPFHPREVAYANHPDPTAGAQAMSAPAFVPARREIWYADGQSGFWVERLSKTAWPTAR